MKIGDSSSEQSDAMAGTPLLTQRFVHPDVSPSSTATSRATPDDTMPALGPGQKDRLGRDTIELDGSTWHPAKDATPALNDCEKELGHTPIEPEVFKKTHVRKKENESDSDVWVEERAERTFYDFHQYLSENLDSSVQLTPELSTQVWKEKVVGRTHKGRVYGLGSRNNVRRVQSSLIGIGSSRQAEALDGLQIAAMSDQIAKLTATLAESERRRVAEQESMSETVQQIKEQVMNLTRRPTTSAPNDIDDESDKDDYVDPTP
ncbi:hypothetical protein MTR67_045398 [Solanum verrucosum]|uniref:Uncharacterized protein n=1 Tax=Solanum verrucosum TaxID=315347 RepID=A0AAF0US70_SOLVR|nr:hypothetical protein MTR67_045398 [Solanum verrucosum]